MDLLALKLILTPLLLLAATMVVRRWGEAIGGFLVGLPLTSGPVSLFLALERGPAFAAEATSGSLIATAAIAAFCVAYCKLAASGWLPAFAGGSAAFATAAGVLQWSGLSQGYLVIVALLGMALALRLTPKTAIQAGGLHPPWWDLPARLALITCVVVGVTMIAPYVGPQVSGVLASFPFIAAILAIFAHRMIGPSAGQQVMRGMVAGLLGFATFFYVLSLMLTRSSLPGAYGSAIVCTLAVQAVSLHRMRRALVRNAD